MIKHIGIGVLLVISCNYAQAETSFNGFYAGIQAGYADGKDDGKEYHSGIYEGYTQKTTPNGGIFGAYFGYNKVFENNLLVGFESDYELRNGDDKSFQEFEGIDEPQYTAKTEMKDSASVRARLGYVFNDGKTLGYLTAGYAMANIKRTMSDALNEGSVPSESDTKWHEGWTAGFGVEHFMADKISLKADYRYSNYDQETINSNQVYGDPLIPGDGYTQKQKYQDEQSVRLGVAYHF